MISNRRKWIWIPAAFTFVGRALPAWHYEVTVDWTVIGNTRVLGVEW